MSDPRPSVSEGQSGQGKGNAAQGMGRRVEGRRELRIWDFRLQGRFRLCRTWEGLMEV